MPSTELEVRTTINDRLVPGLRRSEAGVRSFSTRTRKHLGGVVSSLSGLRAAFLAIGSAVVVRSIARVVQNTANALDAVGKLSTRLGLSTEFITRLGHAAQLTGVDTNTLHLALQRVNRRFGEIAQFGRGEALPALEALGGGIAQLVKDGATFEDVFFKVVEQINKIEDPTKRAAIAAKLFDSEGLKLIQTLGAGSDVIRDYFRESDKLGQTITARQAKDAEDYNDAIKKLTGAFDGLAKTGLPPVLRGLTSYFDKTREGISATKAFVNAIVIDYQTASRVAKEELEKITKAQKDAQDEQQRLNPPGGFFFGPGLPPVDSASDLQRRRGRPAPTNENLRRALEQQPLADINTIVGPTISAGELERRNFVGPPISATAPFAPPGAGLGESPLEARRRSEALEERIRAIRESDKAMKELESTTLGVRNGLEDVSVRFSEFEVARFAINNVADSLVTGISDNLIAIADGTKSVSDAFRDMARSIISDLGRVIAQALIARAVGSLVSSIAGGIPGLGGAAAGVGQIGAQHGAFVPAGVTTGAILHGPEFVLREPQLRAFAAAAASSSGGGGGDTIVFNIRAIDVADFDQKVQAAVGRNDVHFASLITVGQGRSRSLRGRLRRLR